MSATGNGGKFSGAVEKTIYEKKPAKAKLATFKIVLAIPGELKDDIDTAAFLHGGNRTAYINELIKRDLEENLEKYKEFKEKIGSQYEAFQNAMKPKK